MSDYSPRPVFQREDQFPVSETLSYHDYVVLLVGRVTYAWGHLETELHDHLSHLVTAQARVKWEPEVEIPHTWSRRVSLLKGFTAISGKDDEIYRFGERVLGKLTTTARQRHLLSHSGWIVHFVDGELTLTVNNGREMDEYRTEMARIHEKMRETGNNARWRRRLTEGYTVDFPMRKLAALEADIANLRDDIRTLCLRIDGVLTERRHAMRAQQGNN